MMAAADMMRRECACELVQDGASCGRLIGW